MVPIVPTINLLIFCLSNHSLFSSIFCFVVASGEGIELGPPRKRKNRAIKVNKVKANQKRQVNRTLPLSFDNTNTSFRYKHM